MKSIKVKWMLMVVVLLVLFISSVVITNTFFLDKYYVFKTKAVFISEFETIKDLNYKKDNKLYDYLGLRNSETGYKYYVVDDKFNIKYVSSPEFKMGTIEKLPRNQREFIEGNKLLIDSGEPIYDTVSKKQGGQSLVQLAGSLNKKTYIIITQPLEQLQENAKIANDFLLIIGAVFLLISVVLSYFSSKKMVKPILEITSITENIANLDFTERYLGQSKDEVGILGENINIISEKLDNTIDNLRVTNVQLMKEMELQKRFIASVSHEFKTPVGLIRGYAESLKLGIVKKSEEQNEVTEIIIKEADRLNILVKDIVMLMHMDSGTFVTRKFQLDLVELINETVNKFRIHVNDKKVNIIMNMPNQLLVSGDQMRLTQVLENYISNGIRHVDIEGKVRIYAETINDSIKVGVINTGFQIPDEHLNHLFEAFYRVEDARSREKGGTGLGLSVVKGIVESHGGTCGVKNINYGVEFWFEIPLI